jgi:N-acyl-D-aspartate/D-glutamate deacylase
VQHDLVIRGGTVVDGTGSSARTADVAIDGGTITAVGEVDGRGRREIDADGLVVAPGWVDVHTHYDGQVSWDSQLAPSSIHGVTSIVMGNCGVGFAPAHSGSDAHEFLISLMEGVEDIPGTALHEGLTWEWESYPQYLDALARRRYKIDVGSQIPHAALRAFVMGERGADHDTDPTPTEIGEMARLVAEGLEAGAMGFATSRTVAHRSRTGQKIGTLTAEASEILGIAEALAITGRGVLQFVSDFRDIDAELGLMRAAAERAGGRPVSVSLAQAEQSPDRWRRVLDWISRAAADGIDFKAQCAPRTIGLLVGLESTMNPFLRTPTYKQTLRDLPLEERVKRMAEPEVRAQLLREAPDARGGLFKMAGGNADRIFRLGDPADYEPAPEKSLGAEARRLGRDPFDLVYDALLERGGRELLYFPLANYAGFTMEAAREMLLHDRTIPGLSDGGAHVSFISDASFPTFLLTHWCRDRSRGERLPLEFIVKRQTRDTARHVGWLDRGVLAPGYLADVNVIDLDGLTLHPPSMIHDLPAGGKRLMQRADGYVATIKRGEVTFEHGEATDALPGALQRGAQPAPA